MVSSDGWMDEALAVGIKEEQTSAMLVCWKKIESIGKLRVWGLG